MFDTTSTSRFLSGCTVVGACLLVFLYIPSAHAAGVNPTGVALLLGLYVALPIAFTLLIVLGTSLYLRKKTQASSGIAIYSILSSILSAIATLGGAAFFLFMILPLKQKTNAVLILSGLSLAILCIGGFATFVSWKLLSLHSDSLDDQKD